jgi:chloramphenicol O-acetyltransferase
MKQIKFILTLLAFLFVVSPAEAQLKKSASVEKVKTFTTGSVPLYKFALDDVDVYSVTLKNNSRNFEPIVLFLGTKEEMISNLKDLSAALNDGKKGDIFEFESCGRKYHMSFHNVIGQKCFKVWEENNIQSDYGTFFKSTIDDILKYFEKEDTRTKFQ